MGHINMRAAWNTISPHYQAEHQIPADFVHYGPHCPNEDQLQLLGDTRGKRVLEIGCGGGQCSVAFAKRGAIATGLDISDEQVKFARRLAEANEVEATLREWQKEVTEPTIGLRREIGDAKTMNDMATWWARPAARNISTDFATRSPRSSAVRRSC